MSRSSITIDSRFLPVFKTSPAIATITTNIIIFVFFVIVEKKEEKRPHSECYSHPALRPARSNNTKRNAVPDRLRLANSYNGSFCTSRQWTTYHIAHNGWKRMKQERIKVKGQQGPLPACISTLSIQQAITTKQKQQWWRIALRGKCHSMNTLRFEIHRNL